MRLKTAVALTCAAVLVLAGCNRKGSSTHTLAFITNNASDFWTIARKGTEKADAERTDITVEFRLGEGAAAGQKRIVEDLLAKGVDGIAIRPVDPANPAAMVEERAQTARRSPGSIRPTRRPCSTTPRRRRWCSHTIVMRQPASASATSAPTTS